MICAAPTRWAVEPALATIPVYGAVYAWLGRDAGTQMQRLDRGVERISATIVEFIAGVSVVKTFGEAGKAHKRFADAADEFNDSFANWMGLLVRVKAVTSIFIETPLLLLANLVGYWFVRSGWVAPIDMLGSTLVAVTIPAAVLTVGYSTHIRKQAQAAAGRLQRLLQTPTPARRHESASSRRELDRVRRGELLLRRAAHGPQRRRAHPRAGNHHRAGGAVGQRQVDAGHAGAAVS
jgi:ATP-binding cassette subfamily B protein IrtA